MPEPIPPGLGLSLSSSFCSLRWPSSKDTPTVNTSAPRTIASMVVKEFTPRIEVFRGLLPKGPILSLNRVYITAATTARVKMNPARVKMNRAMVGLVGGYIIMNCILLVEKL